MNFDDHLKSDSFSSEQGLPTNLPTKDARGAVMQLDNFWSNVPMPDRLQKYKASGRSPAQLQQEGRERGVLSAKEHAQTVVVVRHTQPSPDKETPEVRDSNNRISAISVCAPSGESRHELCRAARTTHATEGSQKPYDVQGYKPLMVRGAPLGTIADDDDVGDDSNLVSGEPLGEAVPDAAAAAHMRAASDLSRPTTAPA